MTDKTAERPPLIDGYDSWSPLGRGGMGIVYRARQQALDRWVAVKVLPGHLAEAGPACERFRAEARRLARLGHPNVVPIHTFGEADGRPYFTMAYLEGETLQQSLRAAALGDESPSSRWFRRGSPAADRRADVASCVVARALVDALDHVHGLGVVHGDVKPANVLLDPRGRPVLVDLGVACEPTAASLGVPSGTLRFMAPETLTPGAPRIDALSDVYALGLVLFEMLTLRPAFSHEDIAALVDAIRGGEKPALRAVNTRAPPDLDAIIERATAVDPADRFANASELGDALKRVTASLADESEITHLALDPGLERAVSAGTPRRGRSRPRLWPMLTITAFLGAGIGTMGLPTAPAPTPGADARAAPVTTPPIDDAPILAGTTLADGESRPTRRLRGPGPDGSAVGALQTWSAPATRNGQPR